MATLNAVIRDHFKKSVAKTLRKEGQIPSVVYGKTVGNESIAVSAGEVDKLFRSEGRNAIITLNIGDKKKYTVMAHDLQFNNLKGTIQHIDFLEINMNEEIDAVVPVVLQGTEEVEGSGAVVNHQLNELTVRALPKDLPSSIEVDVSKLAVGENIRINDIDAKNGYTIIGDPEEVIVSVSYGGKNEEAEEPSAAEGAQASEEQPAE
ncbi:50S ribosomal protein L25 [Sporolactobacillus putidus]|uniref:Large ribosomal subunit protein bL25 n=1 Tax=Sporolactobacillus putidus TaxID=492735 RepID=A0A917W580_9BACL|nr:50S ribosomal protein L25 [Sporolactobacillus putidus]GGL64132.1 50S ribosomal protein L25 [Sporolactobacillus putidus]